jgi:hypothetical protein
MKIMNKEQIKSLITMSVTGLFIAVAIFLPIGKTEASDYGSGYSSFNPGGYVSDYSPYSGYVSDYAPSTGYVSDYDSYSGYVSDYSPYTGYVSDYSPYTGYVSDYVPYSGYVSDYAPYSYDYSTPSYGGGYSGGSYGGGYTPQPIYDYVYNTPSRGSNGGGASAAQSQYVYSSNENENNNVNANENNNIITNTFNPTNNNDARINLIVYGGGTGTNTPAPTPALNGVCVINPTVAYINQDISFSASASGGNGSYSYSWTGDDGINSAAQSFTGRYSYAGYKTATVTIRSGSESVTRTCGVNVQYNNVLSTQSNVTVIRDQNLGTPVAGVFLSQVPETGIGFGLKMTLFTVGLILWSIFAAFMIARKKNGSVANKINAFKLANMQKKGIQA